MIWYNPAETHIASDFGQWAKRREHDGWRWFGAMRLGKWPSQFEPVRAATFGARETQSPAQLMRRRI